MDLHGLLVALDHLVKEMKFQILDSIFREKNRNKVIYKNAFHVGAAGPGVGADSDPGGSPLGWLYPTSSGYLEIFKAQANSLCLAVHV